MIGELQAMVSEGALRIVPDATVLPVDEALHAPVLIGPWPRSAPEAVLSAENDSLRLSLEQAGIDAQTLLVQAGESYSYFKQRDGAL